MKVYMLGSNHSVYSAGCKVSVVGLDEWLTGFVRTKSDKDGITRLEFCYKSKVDHMQGGKIKNGKSN